MSTSITHPAGVGTRTLQPGLGAGDRSTPAPPALLRRRPTGRRLGPGRPIPFLRALGPVLLVAVWVLASASGWLDERTLSAPWTVLQTFGDLVEDGRLQSNLTTSVQRAALGLGIGVV